MGRVEMGENDNEKGKKCLILRTLERCCSRKGEKGKTDIPPSGCLSVYVGPEKERFVIRTTHVNHPLFRALLDAAEAMYGYAVDGPLVLPCDVESFLETLWEMERDTADETPICGLATPRRSSYRLLSPAKPGKNINNSSSFFYSPLRRR